MKISQKLDIFILISRLELELRELYSLFSEDINRRIISSVLLPRRAFFDCYDRVPTGKKVYRLREFYTKYAGVDVYIKRPFLCSTHERAFYTIFALGRKKKIYNENGELIPIHACSMDFYEFKRYAGFDSRESWEYIKGIFEELRMASFEIRRKNEVLINVNHLVEFFSIDKTTAKNGKEKYTLTVIVSEDLVRLFTLSTFFSISPEVIRDINNTFKEAHVHRSVMYFMTQSKPFKITFEKLMRLIDLDARNWLLDKKKRWKVKQKFRKHKENLKRFKIELDENVNFKFRGKNNFQFIGYVQ